MRDDSWLDDDKMMEDFICMFEIDSDIREGSFRNERRSSQPRNDRCLLPGLARDSTPKNNTRRRDQTGQKATKTKTRWSRDDLPYTSSKTDIASIVRVSADIMRILLHKIDHGGLYLPRMECFLQFETGMNRSTHPVMLSPLFAFKMAQ